MPKISKQIGWSVEANLLYEILKELERIHQDLKRVIVVTTTTTTTTP